MEIIGKVSKGSKMDQIYIPKNRVGLAVGNYVMIKPLEENKPAKKFYFYGVKDIEQIKFRIIKEVMVIINNNLESYDNIIVTGSFLDEGFNFKDIDVIIVTGNKINTNHIKEEVEEKIGIKTHFLTLSNEALIQGLEKDPLYQMMLSRCIARKRFVYNTIHKIDYKMLDLHLLKSKMLIDNFDFLNGNDKYDLVRNMFAIWLYIGGKKLNKETVDHEIKTMFDLKDIIELKQNIINKKTFLKKYKLIYNKTFSKILRGIENDTK